ncbi:MAG: Tol-Pal system protein TolB, partial [Rhodospirillales bacterium]|nr:Tol-Pal system protein TolB [Rhodospirillales bacterium]
MRRLLILSGHVGRTLCHALPLPAAIALTLAILGAAATAKAELRVDITRGHVEPLPIAIVDLAGSNEADAEVGRKITQVITRNLERSGLFRAIDPAAFISDPSGTKARPRFPDWRIINAQALVTGRVVPGDPGRLMIEFRLWDVFAEQQLVGLKLSGSSEAWRPIAHTMSDKIYERLTGESGYFHTRVVYIAETGPPDKRIKRLAIMDQDGHNLRYLSDGRHLVLTPRFSPTAQEITYLSYERGVPKVYLRHIDTGQQELLGDFPGMTFAPRFSPDGNFVVMTLAQGGNSEIYEMDLRSRGTRRLTNNPAIETAPCYSPD